MRWRAHGACNRRRPAAVVAASTAAVAVTGAVAVTTAAAVAAAAAVVVAVAAAAAATAAKQQQEEQQKRSKIGESEKHAARRLRRLRRAMRNRLSRVDDDLSDVDELWSVHIDFLTLSTTSRKYLEETARQLWWDNLLQYIIAEITYLRLEKDMTYCHGGIGRWTIFDNSSDIYAKKYKFSFYSLCLVDIVPGCTKGFQLFIML